ncbi:MAG: class I SAM-dependent methyltransferase [Actinobacteria bacterium]|nr:class I SAM-dependent methyltransferase [Actinomycetota bacterium]
MFDNLFEVLPRSPLIVEVGPGTGQATRDLLARGAADHAIEIGPTMAAKLSSNLRSDRLHVTVGDFERLDITPASADAVFSASAYHWIGRTAQTDRPATILRPGGLLAIVDLDPAAGERPHRCRRWWLRLGARAVPHGRPPRMGPMVRGGGVGRRSRATGAGGVGRAELHYRRAMHRARRTPRLAVGRGGGERTHEDVHQRVIAR